MKFISCQLASFDKGTSFLFNIPSPFNIFVLNISTKTKRDLNGINQHKNWKKVLGIGGIVLSAASLVYIFFKIDTARALGAIFEVEWYYPAAAAAVYLSTFWLRAFRWSRMLRHYPGIKFKYYLEGIVLGFSGNNLIPAKGGELVRMEFFSSKTPVSRVTAFSSAMTVKIIDGFNILLILLIAVWIGGIPFFNNTALKGITISAVIFFAVIIILLVLLRAKGKNIISGLEKRKSPAAKFFKNNLEKTASALDFLNFDKNTFVIFMTGNLIWFLEAVVFTLIIGAYHPGIDIWSAGVVTLAVVNYGLLVPSSPGFVGLFQGFTILALSLYGIGEETAFAVSILVHACQFLPVTLWGIYIIARDSVKVF